MNVGDIVWFPMANGTLQGRIINVNEFRPPEMKYAVQICNYIGYLPDDGLVFVGDENLIRMEGV